MSTACMRLQLLCCEEANSCLGISQVEEEMASQGDEAMETDIKVSISFPYQISSEASQLMKLIPRQFIE